MKLLKEASQTYIMTVTIHFKMNVNFRMTLD